MAADPMTPERLAALRAVGATPNPDEHHDLTPEIANATFTLLKSALSEACAEIARLREELYFNRSELAATKDRLVVAGQEILALQYANQSLRDGSAAEARAARAEKERDEARGHLVAVLAVAEGNVASSAQTAARAFLKGDGA